MNDISNAIQIDRILNYMNFLDMSFEREIEIINSSIIEHRTSKKGIEDSNRNNEYKRAKAHQWRKKSIALHKRRSDLKEMRQSIDQHIKELSQAKERIEKYSFDMLLNGVNSTSPELQNQMNAA